jgi:phosphatidate cytidylyltransferase
MTRVISGVMLAAATLAAIVYLPPLGLQILVAIVAVAAAYEYLGLIGVDDSRGRPAYAVAVGTAAWLVSLSASALAGITSVPWMMLLVAGLYAVSFKRVTSHQSILAAFAILYIGMPLGLLALLNINRGWLATLLLIATVVVSDSLQFYSGRLFGRHALAPAISPKKTIEGALGGVVGGTLFMLLAGPYVFPTMSAVTLALLGFFMVLLGIIGDLFESRLKREANVKDSSALIPGHGGVLDRIDALLFVTPAFVLVVGLT